MKFLFDENVSPTLVGILAREFPNCTHIRDIGLRGAEDGQIWDHARAQDFMIVSKDTDFRERSYVEGFPPKTIWLDVLAFVRVLAGLNLRVGMSPLSEGQHPSDPELVLGTEPIRDGPRAQGVVQLQHGTDLRVPCAPGVKEA